MTTFLDPLDIRSELLKAISYVVSLQRSTIMHNTVFVLPKEIIDTIDSATRLEPEFNLNPATSYRFDDAYVDYRNIKSFNNSQLLGIFFGLFRPVFNYLADDGVLDCRKDNIDAYIGFVLAIMNSRPSNDLIDPVPNLPSGTVC